MKNNLEEITFKLYNEIKRFQGNIDESLAVTLALIYTIHRQKENFIKKIETKTNDPIKNWNNGIDWIDDDLQNYMETHFISDKTCEYIINNIRRYEIFAKVSKGNIYTVIEKLIDDKNMLLEPSMRRTDKQTQKIITGIVNNLNIIGPCIDLAVGTGSLLRDIKGELWGDDINPKMVIIARCYLYFANDDMSFDGLKNDIRLNDCIGTFDYRDYMNAVVIFDPPMGDMRQIPDKWQENQKLSEIITKKKIFKLPSEILFLLNFLINSNKGDYFIGLFPESILTRNNYEYKTLRQYILRNSLLAVIKVQTGHVLLIGINSANLTKAYPEIPVLNVKGYLNSKQIDFITEHIAANNYEYEDFYNILPEDIGSIYRQIGLHEYNKNFAQIFAYKVYDRDELLTTNIIPVPRIILSEEKNSKNPKELLAKIQEKEQNIKTSLSYIENIISNLPENVDIQVEFQWFEELKTEEQIALKYFWDKRFDKYYNSALQIAEFEYKKSLNEEILKNLKTLKLYKRLSFNDNNIVNIHFKKEDNKNEVQPDIFFNSLKPASINSNISKLLKMTDKTVQDIYENHCRYCIDNLTEEDTYILNKKYNLKDIVRSFDVLERLGLVRKIYLDEVNTKSTISLYEEYRTYIPDVDTKGDEMDVY